MSDSLAAPAAAPTYLRIAREDGSFDTKVQEIRPRFRSHPQAPLFASSSDAQRTFEQLLTEVTSERPQLHGREIIEHIRQAGLVSLWFFLRVICGHSGPYDRLNDTIDLDLCNFRQSDYCMKPGARAAIVLPRSFYKSTIGTHGALTWEATRNGDIRARIVNAIAGKAHNFKMVAQRNIDSNALYALCYPECVPDSGTPRWNENEFVMPSRSRYYPEPTIKASGVDGAAEGDHHDLIILDDLIGLDDLDGNKQASLSMESARTWFTTNTRTLLTSVREGRVIAVFTRYAMDDVYAPIMDDAHTYVGVNDADFLPRHDGTWAVYYRQVIEDEIAVKPEVMDKGEYEKLLKEAPWVAITQYGNKPQATGISEFASYPTKKCHTATVEGKDGKRRLCVIRDAEPYDESESNTIAIALDKCQGIMTIDPAGSDKMTSGRTSRSSVGVWFMDSHGNAYRVWQKVGYLSIDEVFDGVFEGHEIFAGLLLGTIVESSAMQKILAPLIRMEESRRGKYVNAIPQPAKGDKLARIRSTLGWYLSQQKVYLAPGASREFEEERIAFPSRRMDVLDESEKALSYLKQPLGEEEVIEIEEREIEADYELTAEAFGY